MPCTAFSHSSVAIPLCFSSRAPFSAIPSVMLGRTRHRRHVAATLELFGPLVFAIFSLTCCSWCSSFPASVSCAAHRTVVDLAHSISVSLRIRHRQKIGLLVVVSFSLLAIVAAMVRVARVTQFQSSSDQTCQSMTFRSSSPIALFSLVSFLLVLLLGNILLMVRAKSRGWKRYHNLVCGGKLYGLVLRLRCTIETPVPYPVRPCPVHECWFIRIQLCICPPPSRLTHDLTSS